MDLGLVETPVFTALSAPSHHDLSQLVPLAPSATSKRPQLGGEATQRGGGCLSLNIPTLMTHLCAPMPPPRLSGEEKLI